MTPPRRSANATKRNKGTSKTCPHPLENTHRSALRSENPGRRTQHQGNARRHSRSRTETKDIRWTVSFWQPKSHVKLPRKKHSVVFFLLYRNLSKTTLTNHVLKDRRLTSPRESISVWGQKSNMKTNPHGNYSPRGIDNYTYPKEATAGTGNAEQKQITPSHTSQTVKMDP